MKPIRFSYRRFLMPWVAGLALVVALAGCGKKPFVETVQQTPYLGLPGGMSHLVSLDTRRLLDRDFVKQALITVQQNPEDAKDLEDLREGLGFDPLKDFESICMAVRGNPAAGAMPLSNAVFIARGHFEDPGPRMEKLHAWLAQNLLIAPPAFREGTHPGTGYKTYALEAASQYDERVKVSLNFGFPTKDLMVFSMTPALLSETLDVIGGVAPGLGKDENWLKMVRRPNIGALLWGTGEVSPQMARTAGSALPAAPVTDIQSYYFSLDFSARFDGVLGLVCGTIASAEKVSASLRDLIKQLGPNLGMLGVMLPETAKLPSKIVVLPKGEVVEAMLQLNEADTIALREEWRKLVNRGANSQGGFSLPGGMGLGQ